MNRPKTLTLTLPTDRMEIVLSALAELPYRVAQPVMDTAHAQFGEQMQTAQTPAADAGTAQ
ncbi:hypothetical protein [Paraburkholderia bryophila]|uniref:Uncharacterized protein n=1 Tax=Paraburkholderia bryophila TaxID=420952 RepID=A0A329B200_9BURK|nr:hypothetical protein [Paraburkholderia bryophila]RAS13404.1 hypothetical protein BX591_1862 [Paraburkholderia bryophila]